MSTYPIKVITNYKSNHQIGIANDGTYCLIDLHPHSETSDDDIEILVELTPQQIARTLNALRLQSLVHTLMVEGSALIDAETRLLENVEDL